MGIRRKESIQDYVKMVIDNTDLGLHEIISRKY